MALTLAECPALLRQAEHHARRADVEPNFFAAGGLGFSENPVSDMMALFMGRSRHVPPWLCEALLGCLPGGVADIDLGTVQVEREVPVEGDEGEGYKRLDILVTTGSFVLGIENKVLAHAEHNPFPVYERLLAQRAAAAGGLPVLRCLLSPDAALRGRPAGWELVTYAALVRQAQALWGAQSLRSGFGKWHVFYREFLAHLDSLGSHRAGTVMDQESEQFVHRHFAGLMQLEQLLEQFGEQVRLRGRDAVRQAFSDDVEVGTGYGNWPGGLRAKRFAPASWGGRSNMALIYFHDAEYGTDDSALGWILRAYLFHTEVPDFDRVRRQWSQVPAREGHVFWRSANHDAQTWWTEQNSKWLVLDAWPDPYTQDGALAGLTAFTQWVDRHVFQR